LEAACADYGQALGTAFQVIDDVLDYAGDAKRMGKNLGDDLREGKATLPLIAAMQRGTAPECAIIRSAIENGDAGLLDTVVAIVQRTGALTVAFEAAQHESLRAVASAELLPQSPYKASLVALAHQSISRDH
jgi:octaprenyl-diphosphate synthase